MAGRGRPKGSHDIAPMIRGAFIRAVKGLEDDGIPLSTLIRQELEKNTLATIKTMATFCPELRQTKFSASFNQGGIDSVQFIDELSDQDKATL